MISICIFGSTARDRFDRLSDKDVLIVAPSNAELSRMASEWTAAGWSVASFTREQFLGMVARGSMFLQHIKQEGQMVRDTDRFLTNAIDNFQPKTRYEDEIYESWRLLSRMASPLSKYWPTLCSADIAYGAVRNIAILSLAQQGRYIFDYYDLIDQFTTGKDISAREISALRYLRTLKHGYRNRVRTLHPRESLREALGSANELFQFAGSLNSTSNTSGYLELRMLELDLVREAAPTWLDRLPAHDPLADVWAHIRNPRGYPKDKLLDVAWIRQVRRAVEDRFAKLDAEHDRGSASEYRQ